MIKVNDGEITRSYPYVSMSQIATYEYPSLCTYTADGEFGFVFHNAQGNHEQGRVQEYIMDSESGLIEGITFWK